MSIFQRAEVLLPRTEDKSTWAVIACDQFTSEPEYWQRVRERVGEQPSALHLIFPEAELKVEPERHILAIREAMADYLARNLFETYPESFVYVERSLSNGAVRRGLVGQVDLERYDYSPQTDAPVRATERTVVERIPPRMKIREGAPLELPHVLLLCDDERDAILAPLQAGEGTWLYDFELMEGGGHIRGRLVTGAEAEAVTARLDAYERETAARYAALTPHPMLYAVGDGNHSLATAKACYEKLKKTIGEEAASRHPARYALAELGSLHDASLQFAPIHRLITGTDPEALLCAVQSAIGGEGGAELPWFAGERHGILRLGESRELPVGMLQRFLDDWLPAHGGEIDYIHGDDTLRRLASRPESLGFLLPPIEKGAFFAGVMAGGVLPRKTFSMGQARDKRYYLEARKLYND